MTPHEEQKIIQWSRNLSNDVHLKVWLTHDKRSDKLRMFCNELSGLVRKIHVEENWKESAEPPHIEVSKNLQYFAVPADHELGPFLEALTFKADNFALLPKVIKDKIGGIDKSISLRLFVSQNCAHCPRSVRDLIRLTVENELINLEIIDGTLFRELAQVEDIQCLPTVLFGDEFRWSGVTPLEDIVEVLLNRDPSDFSISAIERMLEEGNAIRIARMMIESEVVFPEVVEFMTDDRFIIRLGAMAAMEKVVEKNRELASKAVMPLWAYFEKVIEPMQIDILYFMGDAGTAENIPLLESVTSGNHRDHVKEAAKEAIDSIKNRC